MKTKQTLKELMKQILVNEKNQINFLETFSFHQKATGQFSDVPKPPPNLGAKND